MRSFRFIKVLPGGDWAGYVAIHRRFYEALRDKYHCNDFYPYPYGMGVSYDEWGTDHFENDVPYG